jgi:polyisoprenoid-binding protein YceI
MKKLFLAGVLLAALTNAAQADAPPPQWQIDAAHSKLGFVGEQNGVKFEGGFKKFTAQITLDPDHPETGKIAVTVDIASATAGSADRDSMLPEKDWFDTAKFPQAQFVSTAIRKTGPWKYEADATLTIKGLSKNVTLPFTLTREGDHWHALGRVGLMRNDFAIGQGSYASEDYVKRAVDVVVDLEARPQ